MHDLDGRIAMVLDAGPCRIGVESTIVDITQSPARILRQGGVSAEQLSTVLGDIRIVTRTLDTTQAAPAPGMLLKHYAPRTPLMLLRGSAAAVRRSVLDVHAKKRIIWLCYTEDEPFAGMQGIDTMCLGKAADGVQIARSLFAALRAADAEGYGLIVIAEPRGDGVAAAVRDRLYRAAEGVVHTLD
jgi:L-threonylcarbamoyladenylate synthase